MSIVPIIAGDFSLIDNEFWKLRDSFAEQMLEMENHMMNFSKDLLHQESIHEAPTEDEEKAGKVCPLHSWLHDYKSPLIQQDGEKKSLKVQFDMSHYKPEEITVKVEEKKLKVHAKHEEKTDTKTIYREYNKTFSLPKGTDVEAIKSALSKEGVLTVEAPILAIAAGEKALPIEK